jgi:glycosyltransferase involved in cell wall biosynthesis
MKPLLRAYIFASPPPPLGGVASIVSMLKHSLASLPELGFSSPQPKGSGPLIFIRPIANLVLLFRVVFQVQYSGRILFFSSSGFSVLEKIAWSFFVRFCGRHPVMVMVDGHFPAFWHRLPRPLKLLVIFLFDRSHPTLGVQSQSWRCFFQSIFPSADCHVVGASVSSEFLVASPWRDLNPSLTILYIGWITQSKGVADLMQAFAEIASSYPDLRLRLIGPLFDQLQFWRHQCYSLGILDRTDFVGPVTVRQELIAELQNATLFVLPSHAEGLPVALLEAMSLGLPCIATDVGSAPDLFGEQHAGVLVPPHQPSRLALAMDNLLRNPAQRLSLSTNALIRVRSHYGETQFASSYQKLLRI